MGRQKFIVLGALTILAGTAVGLGYFNDYFIQSRQAVDDKYFVKKVVDGDTIEIERFGRKETVRLIGVDTPETLDPRKPVQCFGREASEYSKNLLAGREIRIEPDPLVGERDKYNRLLAYVWLDENQLVNKMLVAGGYAHEYTYRSQAYKYQQLFKDSERQAKMAGNGLWAESSCNGKTK